MQAALKSYRLVKPYLTERTPIIGLGLISLLCVDFLQLSVPRIIKWAVDDLTMGAVSSRQLFRYGLYIVLVALLIGVFRFIWRRCLIGASRRVEEGLRNQLFSHIQTLSAGYFDSVKTGDLMARATNDIQSVRMAVGMGIVALTDAIVLGLAAIGFMLYINVTLTCFAIIPMPAIVVLARVMTKRMHRLYREVQSSFGDLTEAVREKFAGIRIVKAYSLENEKAHRLSEISRQYVGKNMRLIRITRFFFPGMVFFSNLSVAVVLYLGGRQTISLTITPGDFVAFVNYLALITWPMMAMGWVMNLIQRGAASLDRINAILHTEPDIVSPQRPVVKTDFKGEIVFDDVYFRYGPERENVLSKINLSVRAGGFLGVVGATGSGKTTLCKLIPRFIDATRGRVLVDGRDVRKLLLPQLRSQLAVVPQDAFLFSGTIRDNLLMGKSSASEQEMFIALKGADMYDTVMSFPGQLNTIIGEKGMTLSGGQRQRLALARALLIAAKVFVLDDVFSQVDSRTAANILVNMKQHFETQTIIMVSHRISHIKQADLIVVIDKGRIVQTGTHEKLAVEPGIYAQMFNWQEIEDSLNNER